MKREVHLSKISTQCKQENKTCIGFRAINQNQGYFKEFYAQFCPYFMVHRAFNHYNSDRF